MKTYFSIAGHVRGALWARTLGYHHGWKNKTAGGVTCTSKIAVKTKKMCDHCWIDKLGKNKTSFLSLLQLCTTHVGAIVSLDTTIHS